MTIYTLPTILVYIFAVGGVCLLVVLIMTASNAITSSKERPKYKSQAVVKDYFHSEGQKINFSAVSSQLAKRWRDNLPEDF